MANLPKDGGQSERGSSNGHGTSNSGGGGSSSDFVKKLFSMLEDQSHRDIVRWTESGDSFVVIESNEFTKSILPKHFKHGNFASFVRQLNKYDFHKVRATDDGGQNPYGEGAWEFKHPDFKLHNQQLLENIKRKAPVPKRISNSDDAAYIAKLEKEIERLKQNQTSLVKNCEQAKTDHASSLNMISTLQQSNEMRDELLRTMIGCLTSEPEYRDRSHEMNGYDNREPLIKGDTARHLVATYHDITRLSLELMTQLGNNESGGLYGSNAGTGSDLQGKMGNTIGNSKSNSRQRKTLSDASLSSGSSCSPQQISVTHPIPSQQINDRTNRPINLSEQQHSQQHPGLSSRASMSQMSTSSELPSGSANGNGLSAETMSNQSAGMSSVPNPQTLLSLVNYGTSNMHDSPRAANDLQQQQQQQTENRQEGLPPQVNTIPVSISQAGILPEGDLCVFTLGQLTPKMENADNQSHNMQADAHKASNGRMNDSAGASSSNSRPRGESVRVHRRAIVPHWAVPPKVLLVEDDAISRRLSHKFLQIFGCEIDLAVDGLSAVNKMNFSKYDLVLMDIVMPNLDGVSATSLIRQFDSLTPIISMTSNVQSSDVMTYFTHGMNDILPKPFTKDGLQGILEKHLIHLKTMRELSMAPPTISAHPRIEEHHSDNKATVMPDNGPSAVAGPPPPPDFDQVNSGSVPGNTPNDMSYSNFDFFPSVIDDGMSLPGTMSGQANTPSSHKRPSEQGMLGKGMAAKKLRHNA